MTNPNAAPSPAQPDVSGTPEPDTPEPGPEPGPEPAVRLRPPQHRVERRTLAWWALQGLVTAAVAWAAVVGTYLLWSSARPWLGFVAAAVAAMTVVGLIVEPKWRYAVHRWEVTEQAVYGLSGWVVREWRVAPISRIQTVDAVRGPLEQVMGLATLRVTTASSKGAIDIVGLDKDVAADVAERLTAITQQTPGDAT